jgi:hypothetical protein
MARGEKIICHGIARSCSSIVYVADTVHHLRQDLNHLEQLGSTGAKLIDSATPAAAKVCPCISQVERWCIRHSVEQLSPRGA